MKNLTLTKKQPLGTHNVLSPKPLPMKTLLLTLTIAFSALAGYAQEDAGWQLYKSLDGVEIYTMEADCYPENIPAQKGVLVKVVNKNDYDCRIEWDLTVWYNYEKQENHIKEGENHYTTEVIAQREVQGTCDTPYGALYIFRDFITYVSPTKLTRFELENIRVTKI